MRLCARTPHGSLFRCPSAQWRNLRRWSPTQNQPRKGPRPGGGGRVSSTHNRTDTPIAFEGEAGYQADLLMPGVRFKLWPTYKVIRYPWVQVPAGELGVV